MVVVKLVVKVLVAESHGGETMIEKEKTGGGGDFLSNVASNFSSLRR
jgi:hypothetical protein